MTDTKKRYSLQLKILSYEGMMHITVRTKLDYKSRVVNKPDKKEQINEIDKLYKKVKKNAEIKNIKEHT